MRLFQNHFIKLIAKLNFTSVGYVVMELPTRKQKKSINGGLMQPLSNVADDNNYDHHVVDEEE